MEEGAVNRVNNRLSADLPTTKESSIQPLYGILAPLNTIKFEVDVALRVGVKCDMNHVTILFFALGANIVFELFDP